MSRAVSDVEIDGRIIALTQQRNEAQDKYVLLQGQKAVDDAERVSLKSEIASLRGQVCELESQLSEFESQLSEAGSEGNACHPRK